MRPPQTSGKISDPLHPPIRRGVCATLPSVHRSLVRKVIPALYTDPQDSDSCPCCSSVLRPTPFQARDYLTRRTFLLSECPRCGQLETILPQGIKLSDAYGHEYYRSEKGKFIPGVEQLFRATHRRRAQDILSRYRPDSVLEIGCGRGEILCALSTHGVRVAGLESPDAPSWILEHPDIDVRPFDPRDKVPLEGARFDLILIWHVLEHLPDPQLVLRTCRDLLEDGGALIIGVPNRSSLQARLRLSSWFHLDVPRHLHHFNRTSLTRLAEASGWQVESWERGDLLQNLYGALQSVANLLTPGRHNILYWALHGGPFWRERADSLGLIWQLLTVWIWAPLGALLFLLETRSHQSGTLTLVLRPTSTETGD